jgi:hypothetical protein
LCLGLLALGVAGCAHKVFLHGPIAALSRGVNVKVTQAWIKGDRVYVRTYVTNGSEGDLRIDRDGWSLRLPSGEVLPRSVGVTTRHNLYTLLPGGGRDVYVDFRMHGADLSGLSGADLIVGGVSFGADLTPHVVGEVPLTRTPSAVR